MANRYWVGGTGTWSASNTTNWAATSGGAGGQSVPGPSDTVTFNAASGTSFTVTVDNSGSASGSGLTYIPSFSVTSWTSGTSMTLSAPTVGNSQLLSVTACIFTPCLPKSHQIRLKVVFGGCLVYTLLSYCQLLKKLNTE